VEYVAFIFGWINIALFMIALCPQIIQNYRIKQVDALSTGLMIQWLLGDIFNLIGCVLGNQQLTQTILAVYFCAVDCVLIVQYYHYYKRRRSIAQVEDKDKGEYVIVPSTAQAFAILFFLRLVLLLLENISSIKISILM
jgi:hypothetical protein